MKTRLNLIQAAFYALLCCAFLAGAYTNIGSWKKLATIPEARKEITATHINGKLYTAGGMDNYRTGGKCCNAKPYFSEYDIASNKWKNLAPYPTSAQHICQVAYKGKLYCFGGYNGSGSYSSQGFTKRCFVYTPSSDSWKEIASAPIGISAAAGCVYKDKIYIFGGDPNSGFDNAGNKTVYEYDPATDKWSLINKDMPYGRLHIGVGLIGDKAYISPGRPGGTSSVEQYMLDDKVQEFDFTKMNDGAAAWRVMNPMPGEKRTGYISTWPVVNGKLYYIGGEGKDRGKAKYDLVYEFDPSGGGGKGSYREVNPYPVEVNGIGPCAVGNKIYVLWIDSYVLTIEGVPTQTAKRAFSIRSKATSYAKVLRLQSAQSLSGIDYSVNGRIQAGADGAAKGKQLRILTPEK